MARSPAAVLVFALTLGGCGRSAPPPAPPPSNTPAGDLPDAPSPIAGTYTAIHPVEMVCEEGDDGWCEEQVADQMTIRDAGAGRIDVAIELIQTNAHSCTFEGTLAPDPAAAGARRWIHRSDDPDEGPCLVTLTASASAFELASEGCRYYCGARAHLAATFAFADRK